MYMLNMGASFGLTALVHYNHLVVINYVKEYASLPGTTSSQASGQFHIPYLVYAFTSRYAIA